MPSDKPKQERYFDSKQCEICEDIYTPSSGSQKYCPDCRSKILEYRREKYHLGECAKCGAKIAGLKRWCKKPKCQAHKRAYYKKKRKEQALKRLIAKRRNESSLDPSKRIPMGEIRRCQRCGGDAFPNYFHCPACLSIISSKMDDTEHELNLLSRGELDV